MAILRPYIGLLSTLKDRMAHVASSRREFFGKRSQFIFHPRISIITPSYNQAQYLEDAIQSVLKQNYPNFEHIVIDGGSTDGTVEILEKYPHLKWVSEKDGGQSDALNKGLRMATGDIIGIINSDDYYSRNTFRSLVKAVNVHRDAKVFIGDCRFIYEGGNRSFVVSNRKLSFEDIIRYWDTWVPPTQPSIFFRRELLDEFGAFDCSLDKAMDYDLWLRFARNHDFYYIPRTLAVYRFHGKSKSGMGEDWSSFYDEWHQVYLRNKNYSKILPPSPLISIILYFTREDANSAVSCYHELESFLGYVDNQRFKDFEVIVITDLTKLEHESISKARFPISVIHVHQMTRDKFIEEVHKHAFGRFIHCPACGSVYPERWYCDNLTILLNNYGKQQSGGPLKKYTKHKLLADDDIIPYDTLFRLNINNADTLFSVIIPTFNRSSVLIKCLKALAEQDFPLQNIEVIVCDDGSTDDTENVVKSFDAPFVLHYLKKENGGPGAARNMGIRAARGEFLLILNDDAILAANALCLHKTTLDSYSNRRIAVLGKFSLAPEFAVTPFGYLLESTDKLFAYPVMEGHHLYDFSYFYTCNISISRQAILDTGLFDEDFKGPAAEDIELGFRLHQQGYKVYYHPDIVAIHDHEVTPASFYRTHEIRAKWGMLFMFKHPRASTWYNHYDFLKAKIWARDIPIHNAKAQKAIQYLEGIEKDYLQNPQPHKLATLAGDMLPQVQLVQSVSEINGFLNSPFLQPYLQKKYGMLVSNMITLPERFRISVVIPTYNRKDILLKCLGALSCQSIDSSYFEVIVYDDGSMDGTYDALMQFRAKYSLRYFRQENSGQAIARNKAIVETSADIILILNDDAILHPDALLMHLEEHYSRENERVAVLGNFSLHPEYNKMDSPVGHAIQNSDLIFDYKIMKPGRRYNHLFFYTCNISIRKKYLMEVGLFDASFGTTGAEDIEIGYRLYRKGLSVVYRPDCVAWHAHTLEAEGLAKMFATRGKGGVLLFLRHPELPHHYRGICLSNARELMERHERLVPLLSELGEMVNHFNSISFSPSEQDIVLSEKENGINFKLLWHASENEVRIVVAKLIQSLQRNIAKYQSSDTPITLDDAARSIYPTLAFIKWYYDTIGVATSPFLADLIEVDTKLKVRMLMASAFNYFQRKVKGEEYLYQR